MILKRIVAANNTKSATTMARHEGFEPPAFWSVASDEASKCEFSALSTPFAPPFRRFCGTVSYPLLTARFLSWVRLWVRLQ